MLRNRMDPVESPRLFYDHTKSESGQRKHLTYPRGTRAFLYYFTPQDKPRIAGELRLRVPSNDNPASFESVSDLLKANGQIWSRSLTTVSKFYIPLYEKLKEELLVPDHLDAVLSTFPNKFSKRLFNRSELLYTLNDTFIVNFSASKQTFIAITEQGMETLEIGGLFSEEAEQELLFFTGESPSLASSTFMALNEFVGSALARFERSTLPDHEGTRTIVLRFLKIITPVKCVITDSIIVQPEEGELHRRFPRSRNTDQLLKVWFLNIDKKARGTNRTMVRGLQLLWDT